MEHLTLWGLCGLLILNIDSLFVRESSVGILLNVFYPLTRRMPLLKITSACRTKLKVEIFDLIWPNFGALRWGFWLKILLKSQMPHICPGSPPLGPNIDRCIRNLTLSRLGFLRMAQHGEGGREGRGRQVPATYNSKTINDSKMKFGAIVKDH